MIFLEKKQKSNQEGVVLIMSLMILLLMMVSVVALSRVIVGEIKMTRNSDNSIISFYATESAMEEALYYLKFSKETNDFVNYFDQLDDSQNAVLIDDERGFVFSVATTTASYFETFNISTTTPAKTEISLPAAEIPSGASGLPSKYDVDWSIDDCYAGGHASDLLEISYTSLYKEVSTLRSNTTQKLAVCGCTSGSADACDTYSSEDLDDDKFYYFTFRPIYSDVAYLKFTPKLDGTGTPYLPGYSTIQVTGYYRQSVYHITASLPVYAPTSNILNYIIFSESDLTKS